jgi:glycosyltransferase involved in cell wall biosynthesis
MKKKILISAHTLRLGGVERSFLGILQSIDFSKYDVDVFLHKHDGELLKFLPNEVNLLPENKECRFLLEPIQSAIKERVFSVVFTKIISKFYDAVFNLFHKKNADKLDSIAHFHLHKIADFLFPKISKKKYDTVIAFLHPNFIERNKFSAKKYLSFIHTDYTAINIDYQGELKMWKRYDMIAGVSEEVSNNFKLIFPVLSKKVHSIENIISKDFLKIQSEEKIDDDMFFVKENQLCLLSIGRFSYPKNFDNIPFIAKRMKEKKIDFKWFIIGFGGDEDLIKRNIKIAKVENEVIVLGKKENPYPYIIACDYYIQPSRFEGKAVTVREAQILKKPVFIADYSTAKSQVNNGVDGFILPLNSIDFAEKFVEIINDREKILNVVNNLEQFDFTNSKEIKKIEQFIEG